MSIKKRRGPQQPRSKQRYTPLTRERIVEAALALIDEAGLEAFSTRKLGEALACEAMSIYHHYPSKGELLDAIASALLARVELPGLDAGDPLARLGAMARSYLEVARRHPDAFPLLALRRLNSPEAFRFLEWIFERLDELGFDAPMRVRIFRLLGHFATGAALSELAVRSKVPHSTPHVKAAQMDAARYPLTTASTPYLMPSHFDETFEFGLAELLEVVRRAPRKAEKATSAKRR